MLFNAECDEDCDSEICHSDNWRCHTIDEFDLYDMMGNGWDEDLDLCYDQGCDESLLFNSKCDEICNTEACHFDNWVCHNEEQWAEWGGKDVGGMKVDLRKEAGGSRTWHGGDREL